MTVNLKTPRAKCRFCNQTVSASVRIMGKQNLNYCSVRRSIGTVVALDRKDQQDASLLSQKPADDTNPTANENTMIKVRQSYSYLSIRRLLMSMLVVHMSTERKREINVLFWRVVNETKNVLLSSARSSCMSFPIC